MQCFKPALDIAFTRELNTAGWRVEEMIPFTHHALWRKVEKYRLLDNSFSLSASPSSLTPSQPSSPQDPSLSPDCLQARPPLAQSATQPLAPPPPPPLRIPPFPVAVSEGLDYMQSVVPAASGILDMRAVLLQNFRLVEVAMVIGD